MKFYRFILLSLLLSFAVPSIASADQIEDAKAAIKSEDYIKAKRILNSLAQDGDAEAQNLLGAMYVNGKGVDKDITKGLSWIMKAAKQGHEGAQMNAFKLCMDLGNRGDTSAMYNVGYMCLKGWGGEQDKDTCLGWMETAGKMGHESSINALVKIYTEGLFGVTPDEEKAAYWSGMPEALAAGIDGSWVVSAPMGKGGQPMKITYEFKAKGDKLTGTITGNDGEEDKIKKGKIDGNNFSFIVKKKVFGKRGTVNYSGTFLGDTMRLTQITETDKDRGAGSRISEGGMVYPPQTYTAERVR